MINRINRGQARLTPSLIYGGKLNGGWPEFKAAVLKRTGIDLNAYKERQMLRRISTLPSFARAEDFRAYLGLLQRDPDCLREFIGAPDH